MMTFVYCVTVMMLLAEGDGRPEPASNAVRYSIEFTDDTLADVKKHLAKGKAVLVDVRSQEEWNKGHIKGAIFLPIDSLRKNPDPEMLAKKLPRKKILYTFCVVGMRAKAAAIKLEHEGYTVRPLKPGYEELLEAGFEKGQIEAAEAEEPCRRDAR